MWDSINGGSKSLVRVNSLQAKSLAGLILDLILDWVNPCLCLKYVPVAEFSEFRDIPSNDALKD